MTFVMVFVAVCIVFAGAQTFPSALQTFEVTWYSTDSSCAGGVYTYSASNSSCTTTTPPTCVSKGSLNIGTGCFYYKDLPVIFGPYATVLYYFGPDCTSTSNESSEVTALSSYASGVCVLLPVGKRLVGKQQPLVRAQPPNNNYPDGTGVAITCSPTEVKFLTYSTANCEADSAIYQSTAVTPLGCYEYFGLATWAYCGNVTTTTTTTLPTVSTTPTTVPAGATVLALCFLTWAVLLV